jgi:hypothetical protein
MGREIRRVPPNWEHPINEKGKFEPLCGENYHMVSATWIEDFNEYQKTKKIRNTVGVYQYYWEYDPPPNEDDYVNYTEADATWYQVYETISEGTPLTPPFETEQELIEYLVNNKDYWAQGPFEREVAERFVLIDKWVPSMIAYRTESSVEIFNGIECVKAKDRVQK